MITALFDFLRNFQSSFPRICGTLEYVVGSYWDFDLTSVIKSLSVLSFLVISSVSKFWVCEKYERLSFMGDFG